MNAIRRIVRPDREPMSLLEQRVYEICVEAAETGREMPPNDAITELIGSQASGGSTIAGILMRLDRKGYISRKAFQKGRQIKITDTGKETAAPACTAPHWRERPPGPPAPTLQLVRSTSPSVSRQIELEAQRLDKDLPAFLSDLAYIGWFEYLAEQKRGE